MALKKNPTLSRTSFYPMLDFMVCPQRTANDVSADPALKAQIPDGLRVRMESGTIFEDVETEKLLHGLDMVGWHVLRFEVGDAAPDSLRRIAELTDPALTVMFIVCTGERTQAARDRMAEATSKGMSRGIGLMLGTRLVNDRFAGEPDALLREQPPGSPRCQWTYLALDFKESKSFEGKAAPSPYLTSSLTDPWFATADEQEFEGTPKLKHTLQLVMYQHLLESHKRAGGRVGGIIGKEGRIIWRDLDFPYYWRGTKSGAALFDELYAAFRDVQSREWDRMRGKTDEVVTRPELKAECGECVWRDVCRDELEELGDITLLADLTPARAKPHRELGVETVGELASLHWPTARLVTAGVKVPDAIVAARALVESVPATAVVGSRHQDVLAELGIETSDQLAGLCDHTARYADTKVYSLTDSIDQARVWKSQRVHRARGVAHVEVPRAAVELDIDIEDDSGGICYLIGVRETIRSRGEVKSRYIPFVTWENTADAEADVFARFWAYVQDKIEWAKNAKIGSLRAYYYTEHESRYFRHLAKSHAGKPGVPSVDDVEAFLTSDVWFDMQPIIGRQLVWPVSDRTLKSLAKCVKFFWRDETPGGANSVAWYREAIAAAETDPERAAEWQQRILDYNEDDVEATWVLREWVSRLGESRKPGTKLPEVSELDRRYDRRPRRKKQ